MVKEYPSDWDTRREKIYRRDNFTCQNCGAKGGPKGNNELHAHHIVPKGKGGTHKLSNLKTLCNRCHKSIHSGKMAPTAHGECRGDSLDEERLISEGTFTQCPICNSSQIGVGKNDTEVSCADCGLELERTPKGLSVQNINKNLIDDSSPLVRIDEYTLSEPAWNVVKNADREADIDFQELEVKSEKYERRLGKIRNSKIPPAILISSWLGTLLFLNIIMPAIAAWTITFALLLAIPILLLKYDKDIKMFIFKISS